MKSLITKIALFAMLASIVTSCNVCSGENKKNISYENNDKIWGNVGYMIQQKTIDSCEYIIIFGMEGRNIIHKANSRNTNHTCK